MKLKQIQELSFKLVKEIEKFNQSNMPNGYFLTTEIDGSLIITRESDNFQTSFSSNSNLLNKSSLTKEEIEMLFNLNKF